MYRRTRSTIEKLDKTRHSCHNVAIIFQVSELLYLWKTV